MHDQRVIIHVDMDAFYASVEQLDNPALCGVPLIVGGSANRGVVAAASYEVRKFGVHSAMPIREALRRCPDAVCVRPRMTRYRDVSRRIFAIFAAFTPLVEGLSLDEAYLDVSESNHLFGGPAQTGARIRERVRTDVGLTASVGIGPNKMVAKIASDLNKPNGFCEVTAERVHEVLDPLPVGKISGVGPKTVIALQRLGIATIGELRAAPEGALLPAFGRYAARMRQRASGIDDRAVVPDARDKSISAEETFDENKSDRKALVHELGLLTDRVAARVRRKGLAAGVVTVKLRTGEFVTSTRQRAFSPPTAQTSTLCDIARALLDTWLDEHPQVALRLLGVGVSDLMPKKQLGLFDEDPAPAALDEAVDSIREKFGADTLRRGG